MSAPIIGRLEALLARVQKRAKEPRVHHVIEASTETVAPPSIQTVPPSPDARAAIAQEISVATPVPAAEVAPVAPPIAAAESQSQLVVARAAEEQEPLTDEEVLELDDRHVVSEEATIEVIEEEEAPPSSRRQKPIDEVPEPEVPHPAPPESGRQIAAQELSFEDDLTGVREARKEPTPPTEPPEEQEAISLQAVSEPVSTPKRHSMELEIPTFGAPGAFTPDVTPPPVVAPPPPVVPVPAASQVQVSRPEVLRPEIVAADLPHAEVAHVSGAAPASFEPKTFGELLDAALAL